MAARKRKPNESYNAYRKNLKDEEKVLQVRLGGKWFYKLTDHIIGTKLKGRLKLPAFRPFKYDKGEDDGRT